MSFQERKVVVVVCDECGRWTYRGSPQIWHWSIVEPKDDDGEAEHRCPRCPDPKDATVGQFT